MDIDFITTVGDGFKLSIDPSGGSVVTGNRKLVNRFEVTFLTNAKTLVFNGATEVDGFGGNAESYIGRIQVLRDIQAIAASVQSSIDATVRSMVSTQDGLDGTEKIESASLTGVDIINGVVVVDININPVILQDWSVLSLNLPITRYEGVFLGNT